jgi:protein phosphatase
MTDPNKPRWVAAFGQSDVGLVRENNEDSFLIADLTTGITTSDSAVLDHSIGEKGSLFLVADGMGGGKAGEVASRLAVGSVLQHFHESLRSQPSVDEREFAKILKAAIQEANRSIFQEGQIDSRLSGMGTTLTAAAVHQGSIFFAQLGDSRAYLVRNGCITQMTRDQSLVAQLVEAGSLTPEEAKTHPQRHIILQALGIEVHVNVIMSFDFLRRRDRIVLCSDGLSGKVGAEEINEVVHKWANPKDACGRLVELARERGGEDNITVIVACFDGEALSVPDSGEIGVYNIFKDEPRRSFWPWSRRQN